MGKLIVFNFITINGFYKGENEDISWHQHSDDKNAYASEMMQSESILLFGRVTYELMASYWPTDFAKENDPEVAEGMNASEKIVVSSTLKKADWNNTTLISGDLEKSIIDLKKGPKDLTILGSGNLVRQLTDLNLIDEYKLMVDPIVLGKGTPLFDGLKQELELKLVETIPFSNGSVLLSYIPF